MQVASILYNDVANGPGLRCTVFMQGCCHFCKGCHSPHTWDFKDGETTDAEQLIDEIRLSFLDDAITWTGGDPVYQLLELVEVMEYFKDKKYDQIMYTGFTMEQLNAALNGEAVEMKPGLYLSQEHVRRACECCSYIVCDPFVLEERSLDLNFRGSRNQRIAKYVDGRLVDATAEWDKLCAQ